MLLTEITNSALYSRLDIDFTALLKPNPLTRTRPDHIELEYSVDVFEQVLSSHLRYLNRRLKPRTFSPINHSLRFSLVSQYSGRWKVSWECIAFEYVDNLSTVEINFPPEN